MDKNAIKKFAVWARTELIARVSLKGVEYGITEDNIEDANADSVGGKVLTADEKKQRQALIAEINDKGYKQVMEEVAYTWFNRFSALRFMEVKYGMSHLRIFMTVSYKWRICKVSLRNILPDSIPQKRKVSGKNILRATIRWTLITVCSILVFKRVWRLPIFCWMICSSMLSIRWKDFIRTGS